MVEEVATDGSDGSNGSAVSGVSGPDDSPCVQPIGEVDPETIADAPELFDRAATGRVVFLWLLTPTVSTIGSYVVFALLL
ncbi:hypothetical protein BRD01_00865 [Halobacteriales archaeon QS_8_65_32]|nr:MAG: hypothetical protein BRD01_00865 [Halobacteriales archaeon QS_8_65_32]